MPSRKKPRGSKKRTTRNKFEENIWKQLKKLKCKFQYESEKIPYLLARHYIPDFIIDTVNGKIYIECKGYLRPEDKSKLRAVKKLNPHMDLRILFYAEKKTQIRWAEKHGFKYAIYKVPQEWVDGRQPSL